MDYISFYNRQFETIDYYIHCIGIIENYTYKLYITLFSDYIVYLNQFLFYRYLWKST